MERIILAVIFLSIKIKWSIGAKSSIITNCEWYNQYDFDTGVIFSCNGQNNGTETEEKIRKNQKIYFGDSDGVECFKNNGQRRYCNKHMIDTIRFSNCQLYHIPYTTFKSYPYLRVLDISQLALDSLQPEHLIGAKRPWELLAGNNDLKEIPVSLFTDAGCVTKVDLSYNKIAKIEPETFRGANELTILDLSGNRLTELNERTFDGLGNLTHMNLANNQIHEIHPYAFAALKRLYHLDVSYNSIAILRDRTFLNLTRLNRLQLSRNCINQIEPLAFTTAHNLLRLDLSHNNITDDQIFDHLYNLQHLDLSHNPINELGIGTFAKLIKLEHLDLGHTNLSHIELGTFSYQRGLVSLDLSENNLNHLDFGLFLPAFRYMESLYLDGNQLTDMNGFTNSLFPQLNALGITNNRFNCTYLKRFMRSVDWEQIRLPVDRMPLNIHQTNIRGVACDLGDTKDTSEAIIRNESISVQTNQRNSRELDDAIEELVKHLPSDGQTGNDADVKAVKLHRKNGSKVLVLLW